MTFLHSFRITPTLLAQFSATSTCTSSCFKTFTINIFFYILNLKVPLPYNLFISYLHALQQKYPTVFLGVYGIKYSLNLLFQSAHWNWLLFGVSHCCCSKNMGLKFLIYKFSPSFSRLFMHSVSIWYLSCVLYLYFIQFKKRVQESFLFIEICE